MDVKKIFSNLGHAAAWFGKHLVADIKLVASKGDAINKALGAEMPTIEAITADFLGPQAAAIEDAVYHGFGVACEALDSLSDAASADGLNVQYDRAAKDKILAAWSLIKARAKGAPLQAK